MSMRGIHYSPWLRAYKHDTRTQDWPDYRGQNTQHGDVTVPCLAAVALWMPAPFLKHDLKCVYVYIHLFIYLLNMFIIYKVKCILCTHVYCLKVQFYFNWHGWDVTHVTVLETAAPRQPAGAQARRPQRWHPPAMAAVAAVSGFSWWFSSGNWGFSKLGTPKIWLV